MAQLCRDAGAFAQHRATVALITMGTPQEADVFCRTRSVPFVCLSNPSQEAYRAYGLNRATYMEMMGSGRVLVKGTISLLKGHGMGRPVGDPKQMPGVFIVAPGGIVRYVHRHRDTADNPPNEELFRVLESL